MAAQLVAEQTIVVGKATTVEGRSPAGRYAVVFEDDGTTGYLYGLDFSQDDLPIVDALHIYNASQVVDGDEPSVVQIAWSADGKKAALLINRHPHAVFDFEEKRGYCRTAFPQPNSDWTLFGHEWDDAALQLFM